MGNQANHQSSIEDFLSELSIISEIKNPNTKLEKKEIINLINDISNKSLVNLKKTFRNDPLLFEKSKREEREKIQIEKEMNKEKSNQNNFKESDKKLPEKQTIIFIKNFTMIPSLIEFSEFNNEFINSTINNFFDVAEFFKEEKVFLDCFMMNSSQVIINLLINSKNYLEDKTIIRISKIFFYY